MADKQDQEYKNSNPPVSASALKAEASKVKDLQNSKKPVGKAREKRRVPAALLGKDQLADKDGKPKATAIEHRLAQKEAKLTLESRLLSQPSKNNLNVKKEPMKRTRMADFTTIYVLGNASAGKTTLINRLLDRQEIPKPTIGLDYTFARRTVQNPDISEFPIKEVCNIWELGGDALKFADLVETPVITNRALDKMAIFLVLDLSEPLKLWPTLDSAIKCLKRGITEALANSMRNNKDDITKKLEENILDRLGTDFPATEKPLLEPFPLPMVIIGTKFDIFQNFEPERRKQVAKLLRLASHRLGASLNFFSKNEVAHSRRVREIFAHYAFRSRFPKEVCQDFNKGLQIPHGGDAYEQIWPGSNPSQFTFDYFKHLYESQVGKNDDSGKQNVPDDPNFREPQIDSQRNILLEELRMMEESFRQFGRRGLLMINKS